MIESGPSSWATNITGRIMAGAVRLKHGGQHLRKLPCSPALDRPHQAALSRGVFWSLIARARSKTSLADLASSRAISSSSLTKMGMKDGLRRTSSAITVNALRRRTSFAVCLHSGFGTPEIEGAVSGQSASTFAGSTRAIALALPLLCCPARAKAKSLPIRSKGYFGGFCNLLSRLSRRFFCWDHHRASSPPPNGAGAKNWVLSVDNLVKIADFGACTSDFVILTPPDGLSAPPSLKNNDKNPDNLWRR